MADTILALTLHDGNDKLVDGSAMHLGKTLKLKVKGTSDNLGGSPAGRFKFAIRIFSRGKKFPFQHKLVELSSQNSGNADISTAAVDFTPVQRGRHSFRVMGWKSNGGPPLLAGVKRTRVRVKVTG